MPSYIVFHPDRQRQQVKVRAKVLLKGGSAPEKEDLDVFIDHLAGGNGNEDPWVLSHPWLYSFCHATQLKRSKMGTGDIVFFVNGDAADKGDLRCDTVFVVEQKLEWMNGKIPSGLAEKYKKGSDEYQRHLIFGLPGLKRQHPGKFTFTAKKHSKQAERFSFLPLCKSAKNVEIPFERLGKKISSRIQSKCRGKYPVKLTDDEAKSLYYKISMASKKRVVSIEKILDEGSRKFLGGCNAGC